MKLKEKFFLIRRYVVRISLEGMLLSLEGSYVVMLLLGFSGAEQPLNTVIKRC